jgi:hypothetical protein
MSALEMPPRWLRRPFGGVSGFLGVPGDSDEPQRITDNPKRGGFAEAPQSVCRMLAFKFISAVRERRLGRACSSPLEDA